MLSSVIAFPQDENSFAGTYAGTVSWYTSKWKDAGKCLLVIAPGKEQGKAIIYMSYFEMEDARFNEARLYAGDFIKEEDGIKLKFRFDGRYKKEPEKLVQGEFVLQQDRATKKLSGYFTNYAAKRSEVQLENWTLSTVEEKYGTDLVKLLNDKQAAGSTATAAVQQQSSPTPASAPVASTANGSTTKVNSLKAGTIHPDAVKMEVDEMWPFFGQYAVIKRGKLQTFINDEGKLVVDFGKYFILANNDYLFTATSLNLTSRGKSNVAIVYKKGGSVDVENYANVETEKLFSIYDETKKRNGFFGPSGKIYYSDQIDYEGYASSFNTIGSIEWTYIHYLTNKSIQQPRTLTDGKTGVRYGIYRPPGATWSSGLRPARMIKSGDFKEFDGIGYVNRYGDFKVPPQFEEAQNFYNGVAWVAVKNQFGEMFWGLIDTSGKTVIAPKFRHEPTPFSHGRAFITPVDNNKVDRACIDKSGNILFTLPKSRNDTFSVSPYLGRDNYPPYLPAGGAYAFCEGYLWVNVTKTGIRNTPIYLMDTSGRFFDPLQRILSNVKELGEGGSIRPLTHVKNGEFVFIISKTWGRNGMGIARVDGSIVVPPLFGSLAPFEKESKLQYAAIYPDPDNGRTKSIKGYIDREGVFRIVLVEKSGY